MFFLDTETTGNGPSDRVIQLAYKTESKIIVNELFNQDIPISIGAMSIHHITNEMIKNKTFFVEAIHGNRYGNCSFRTTTLWLLTKPNLILRC